jgi:hypothetical protein
MEMLYVLSAGALLERIAAALGRMDRRDKSP